jgi:translation initiation factor 5A
MKEQAEVRELKEGRYMLIDDEPCKIDSITKSKPGKHGAAKARIEARSIFTGSRKTYTGSVTDKIWVPMMDRRNGQILSVRGDIAQIMDADSYETFELDIPAELKDQCEAGKNCIYIDSMGRRMMQQMQGA